jgi:Holliday junction resolvasome RuvABC endonuclease subunit
VTVGIDVSTRSIDVVLLRDDGRARWFSRELDSDNGWAAADSIRQRVVGLRRVLIEARPDVVAFEDPFSQSRGTAKVYGLLIGACMTLVPQHLPIMGLSPNVWKTATVGNPRATKADVAAWAAERWTNPLNVVTQDAFDAYAIAWAGRELHRG